MAGHGIPHHAEKESHKQVGIVIAVIAVVMAIVTALANQQANTVIGKEVQASNGFALYRAKRQRSHLNETEIKRADFELAGVPTDAQRKLLEDHKAKLKAKYAEYEVENREILAKAGADRQAANVASHKPHWLE